MATIRNQIIAAVVAALNGAGKPTGVTVEQFSLGSLEPTALPHINVRPVRESVAPATASTRCKVADRTLTLAIECRAVSTGPTQSVDVALDPLLAWVTKAVLADPGLGGLAVDTFESSVEWQGNEEADSYGLVRLELSIRYVTKTQDQEVKP